MDRRHLARRHARGREVRDVVKVIACGAMIGTAILFPLANVEGLWFRAVTLSIFVLSALGFHALHSEPFIRFGPYTAAAALIFLLVAVLSAGSSRAELIPWLPVFIASLSLFTIAVNEVAQRVQPFPLPSAANEFAGVSIGAWSVESARSLSTQPGRPPPGDSNRLNSLYFARHGPPSRSSHRTVTDTTEISLSSVVGQRRPHWDSPTQSYFSDPKGTRPEEDIPDVPDVMDAQDGPCAGTASHGEELEPDGESDLDSVEPSRPLLGRH